MNQSRRFPSLFILHPSAFILPQSGRQESNLQQAAYQTAASPLGLSPIVNQYPREDSNLNLDLRTVACVRHTAGMSSVPRPGFEPGTPRSKRGMISVSPPGHHPSAEGEGVEPSRLIALPLSKRFSSPVDLPLRSSHPRQWTRRGSNPDCRHAIPESSR